MGYFSEESMLLIRNWDAVHDILHAEKQLRNELYNLFHSIEADLSHNEWWQDGWVFFKNAASSEVYISRRNWRAEDEFIIWIGVEGCIPDRIFGDESPANCYVYIPGKRYELATKLAKWVAEGEDTVLGQVDSRSSSGYVIRHAIRQCLPEEVDGFEEVIRSQIVHFFTHYANTLTSLDETIQEYLVSSRLLNRQTE